TSIRSSGRTQYTAGYYKNLHNHNTNYTNKINTTPIPVCCRNQNGLSSISKKIQLALARSTGKRNDAPIGHGRAALTAMEFERLKQLGVGLSNKEGSCFLKTILSKFIYFQE
ncbi:unnamed protein product, partial [Didymodactylos carnosus]